MKMMLHKRTGIRALSLLLCALVLSVSVFAANTPIVITLDPAGGDCSVLQVQSDDGTPISYSQLPVPQRNGYCFLGWCDASGIRYSPDATFSEDTLLTAQWVSEASRLNDLMDYLEAQGFSPQRTEQIAALISRDEGAAASTFSTGTEIWIFLSIAELLAIVCMAVFIVKNADRREKA